MSTLTLTLSLLLACAYVRGQNPVVTTVYGDVEGISVPIHTGQVIDTFMAVPYARAPVGDLRFAPPAEPVPWSGSLLAHEPGAACMQGLITGVDLSHWQWSNYSEDCLNMNIYSPQRDDAALLPVLVFIHGGDFYAGANFIYSGYFQAAYDVISVTLNYRLNIMGFATTEDDVVPGNMGLLDQALALQFIQDNIEAFGGDPNRVTISGESAGAGSVGLHLVSPVSAGLFHGAILESGTELDYWVLQGPEQNPSSYLREVAESVNCTTASSQEMVDCLRTVDAQTLVTISGSLTCTEGYDCHGSMRPVIDGTFLTDYPSALRQRGEYNRVPEMLGVNEDEGSMWLTELVLRPEYDPQDGLNRSDFEAVIRRELTLLSPSWPDPSRLDDAVEAVSYYYTDYPYKFDPFSNRDQVVDLFSDLYFGHSSNEQAVYHSADQPVYWYVYDYTLENGNADDMYGTFHAAELDFTFGTPMFDLYDNDAAYNHSQRVARNRTEFEKTATDGAVSEFMMTLWTNFAKFGNPTPEPVGVEGSTEITWPQFASANRSYAYLADTPEVRSNYRQQNYAFWTDYLRYITHGDDF